MATVADILNRLILAIEESESSCESDQVFCLGELFEGSESHGWNDGNHVDLEVRDDVITDGGQGDLSVATLTMRLGVHGIGNTKFNNQVVLWSRSDDLVRFVSQLRLGLQLVSRAEGTNGSLRTLDLVWVVPVDRC